MQYSHQDGILSIFRLYCRKLHRKCENCFRLPMNKSDQFQVNDIVHELLAASYFHHNIAIEKCVAVNICKILKPREEQKLKKIKKTFKNLQNRELLILSAVAALPNDSKIGFDASTIRVSCMEVLVVHKNRRAYFVVSVFPDPVIPVISID